MWVRGRLEEMKIESMWVRGRLKSMNIVYKSEFITGKDGEGVVTRRRLRGPFKRL